MIVSAIAIDAFIALMYLQAPHMIGPMEMTPPPLVAWLVPAFGLAAHAIGLIWMIRIYRATLDPEAHRSVWRSRAR
jgi:hypothetical protein